MEAHNEVIVKQYVLKPELNYYWLLLLLSFRSSIWNVLFTNFNIYIACLKNVYLRIQDRLLKF